MIPRRLEDSMHLNSRGIADGRKVEIRPQNKFQPI